MKKIGLLVVLLCTVFVTACNHEVYDMTFEEAVQISSQSDLKDLLLKTENYQEILAFDTSISTADLDVGLNLDVNSKNSLLSKKSEMSLSIKGDMIASGTDMDIEGKLSLKTLPEVVYLNLESFDLTGDDSFAMMNAMLNGFKNQWFSIPSTGDLSSLNIIGSYIENIKNSDFDNSQLYVNEGESVYDGKYSEFKGLNAWKFSLDDSMMSELMDKYYDTIRASLESSDLGMDSISGDWQQFLSIEDFEGYLVITGKEQVAVIIESMTLLVDGVSVDISTVEGEDEYKVYVSTSGSEVLSFEAIKHRSQYAVELNVPGSFAINGKINPKVLTDAIDLKYDLSVSVDPQTLSSMYVQDAKNPEITIKGTWNFDLMSDFDVDIPENSQDLTELLGSYFGGENMMDEENSGIEIEENDLSGDNID